MRKKVSNNMILKSYLEDQKKDLETIRTCVQELKEASIRNEEQHKAIDQKLDEYKTCIGELKTDLSKRDIFLENQITISAEKHELYHQENESKFGVARTISKHPWRFSWIIAGLILFISGLDQLLVKGVASPFLGWVMKLLGIG